MDYEPRTSVGRVRFELDSPHPMGLSIAIPGVAVSVGAWSAKSVPAPAGGAVLPASSVGMSGKNAGSSW